MLWAAREDPRVEKEIFTLNGMGFGLLAFFVFFF